MDWLETLFDFNDKFLSITFIVIIFGAFSFLLATMIAFAIALWHFTIFGSLGLWFIIFLVFSVCASVYYNH